MATSRSRPRATLGAGVAALALAAASVGLEGRGRADRRGVEEAVWTAVFRHQIATLLDEHTRAAGGVLCLFVDPGGAPQSVTRDFLKRFEPDRAVRRGAECEAVSDGAVDVPSGAPAILVTAGPIEWVAQDEARVQVSHFRSRVESGIRTYRVVQEAGDWVCLGQILMQAPHQTPPR
jgi:hypothetical protein